MGKDNKEEEKMEAIIERPTTPAESLKKSLEDMKQIRQGKQPRKTWDDYIKEQKEKE
ncbi:MULTISPECIES: hypothetical protein [unclassified Paenibacillus]|uniref:hypothetical protein n=1 Tax=unclassified Paenibacillus TaxID=185978 RepID=UPI000B0C9DA0|nr:hypothetical protein [Paenibacillus sp. FSL P4-0081]